MFFMWALGSYTLKYMCIVLGIVYNIVMMFYHIIIMFWLKYTETIQADK